MVNNIREWQGRNESGDFDSSDVDVQVEAGWIDWQCDDSELAAKTRNLSKAIMRMKDGGKIDLDGMCVAFLNTKPDDADAYDIISVMDDDKLVYMLNVDDKRSDGKWKACDANGNIVFSGKSVVQLAKWLNEPVVAKFARMKVDAGFTLRSLAEAIESDSLKNHGVAVKTVGVHRRYFRDSDQIEVWLSSQLERTEPGTALAAIFGDTATIGYIIG